MPRTNELCLFLHIPKAAGTTLQSILARNFPESVTCVIGPEQAEQTMEHYRELPHSLQNRIRAVRGHMPFGIHRHLTRGFSYVTLLRHPVDRIVSHYYYVKQCGPAHYLYEDVRRNAWSLAEYARSRVSSELDNGQVRLLTDTENSVPVGGLTREHLELAKDNLVRYFGVVGTVDHFDEFLIMLRRKFQLQSIDYDRENVTRNRPRLKDLSEADRNAILEWNRFDLELYEFAQILMREQIEAYGPDFAPELAEFHRRQRYRRRLEHIKAFVRPVLNPARRAAAGAWRRIRELLPAPAFRPSGMAPLTSMSSGEINCYREGDR